MSLRQLVDYYCCDRENGGDEEEANKHCQIDYLSGDIDSELQEQLQMQMPTFLELSSMMIDFTKSCNYYYCCDDDEWGVVEEEANKHCQIDNLSGDIIPVARQIQQRDQPSRFLMGRS